MKLLLVVPALLASVVACSAIDTAAPPSPGPCNLVRLDPADPSTAFASRPPCIVVTWDTTEFPSALTGDGGVDGPAELRSAAAAAGYLDVCDSTVTTASREHPGLSEFAARFGSLTPGAVVWGASLFLPDPRNGTSKAYCHDWLGIQ